MLNNVTEILKAHDMIKFATTSGTDMHNRLARIVIDGDNVCGESELINKIQSIKNLAKLFSKKSRIEVPVAGNIGNRLYVDDEAKTVYVLDYKTDVCHDTFHDRYVAQLQEYATLLRQIYSQYKIQCFILWTHDWSLESV